jgi:hypothetical protein
MVGGDQKWAAQRYMQVFKPSKKRQMQGKGVHTEGRQDREALHSLNRRWVILAMCKIPLDGQGHTVMHGPTKPTPMHAMQFCC